MRVQTTTYVDSSSMMEGTMDLSAQGDDDATPPLSLVDSMWRDDP